MASTTRSYGPSLFILLLIIRFSTLATMAYDQHHYFVEIPSFLAAQQSPLTSLDHISSLIQHIRSSLPINSFCDEAKFICDEDIEVIPLQLHALTSYCLPFNDHMQHHLNHVALADAFNNTSQVNLQDVYFGESKLHLGNALRLVNPFKKIPRRAFLPPSLLDIFMPLFSSNNLHKMLDLFNISSDSNMAISMEDSLLVCGKQEMENEIKTCVSTLDEMVEFAISIIGTTSLRVLVGANETLQEEKVEVIKLMELETKSFVACHNIMFPYQVFYCHYIQGSKLYQLTLETTEGKHMSTMVACHQLSPQQNEILAQFGLEIKLDERLCHWNFGDNIVWVPI